MKFCRALALLVIAVGCGGAGGERDAGDAPDSTDTAADGVVEVTAVDYAFQAPAEIRSGWTTLRFHNAGQEEHFMLLWKLPEGRDRQDYIEGFVQPFATAFDSLNAGVVDLEGMWILMESLLPEWAHEIEAWGGPGLIAPGGVAEITLALEPGSYAMECYVKTPEGQWHTQLGMLSEIRVTKEKTKRSAPEADARLIVTNTTIETEGDLSAGRRTVAVQYGEHPEHGLGNDAHLARIDELTSLSDVVEWTHWWVEEGMRAPAPATFVGGAQEMPVGHTSYVTVDLEPGRYLWLTEATDVDGQIKEFRVE